MRGTPWPRERVADATVVVAPFFRASVTIASSDRRLFARALATSELEVRLRHAPEILRQNLRRLFAAALLADSLGAPLVFVEGWRSNAVESAVRARRRFRPGSWFFAVWLRALQRRGLLPRGLAVVRREISRCTWEEARALVSAADQAAVLGVSDAPCPSAARARRYLRAGDSVLTPIAAVARASVLLTPPQLGFWRAVQPRGAESLLAPLVEAPNWVVHGASELLRLALPARRPLEWRLAVALRRDRR